ncbi:MAG: CocE/NonD family hydrolase [Alphaproteobacteria bacterium]|nr:CocE/NonD family hydrolase [Alphaproteobacteria bacterium]
MRTWALSLLLLAGCLAQVRRVHDLPSFTHAVGAHEDVAVPARDGVVLATHVWLPDGVGPWPVVLSRTPYPLGPLLDGRCRLLARYGYACVWQEVRGQGRSEGAWVPFVHERADGLDTLAWIDAQPWSAGRVAMIGASYLAGVQWELAIDPPPSLVTIVPTVFAPRPYEVAYEHGLFRHELGTAWMTLIPDRGLHVFSGARYRRALRTWPRLEMDRVAAGRELPWFRDWLRHPDPDDPWWQDPEVIGVGQAPARTPLPVLMIGGWSDAFLGGTLSTWRSLATRDRSALVVGPWNHTGGIPSDVPLDGVGGGPGSTGWLSQWPRVLDWLDHHLLDQPLRYGTGAAVYVPVRGGWEVGVDWPPPTHARRWWLADAHRAPDCQGRLDPHAGQLGEVGWTHDPLDPVPTVGGAGMLAGVLPFFGGSPQGFRRERGQCARRADLLGFASAPLDAPLELAGSVRASLLVRADADDAAVVVRLLQEGVDGHRVLLREGATTLRHRVPDAPTGSYVPGTLVRVEVETWPLAWQFAAGTRVVLEIGSSSFPKYESHPGTAQPWAEVTVPRRVQMAVQLGGSHLELPVLDR